MPRTFARCAFARRRAEGIEMQRARGGDSERARGVVARLKAWFGRGGVDGGARPRCAVRVVCAGVNPVDAKHLVGDKLWRGMARRFARTCVEGLGVGFDFSGVVVRADRESEFSVGDRVYGCAEPGAGAIAEYVDVPADQIAHKPTDASWRECASIGLCAATIAQTLDLANREAKTSPASALVIGVSGGLGHIAARVLVKEGVEKVVGVCSRANVDFVSSRIDGIDVIAYDDSSRTLEVALTDYVAKHGKFDLIIDTVTSNDPRDLAADYPKRLRGFLADAHGQYVTFGGEPSRWAFAVLRRCGVDVKIPYQDRQRTMQWVYFRGCERQLRYVVDSLGVRPIVSASYAFTEEGVRRAMADLKTRRVKAKIVIDVDPETIARDDPPIA